ncbi:hypothetical protein BT69DRAFT_626369 [Atractiella rhizophila]|nr:hypothetical protein BT69DRAFT_626369 [Atractiella rhizophila]
MCGIGGGRGYEEGVALSAESTVWCERKREGKWLGKEGYNGAGRERSFIFQVTPKVPLICHIFLLCHPSL